MLPKTSTSSSTNTPISLTEYGFILPSNKWDEVSLDLFILPLLTKSQKETLEEAGFLGKYVLDNNEACHRTQVVMRLLCVSASKWQRFVDGLDDGEKDQAIVNRLLVKVSTLLVICSLDCQTSLSTRCCGISFYTSNFEPENQILARDSLSFRPLILMSGAA